MLRCIQLGENALGVAAPNPMVGALVVHHGKIIGEGYTSPFGGPHAEVNAIGAVTNKSLLKESCLYVTLEPCSHHGKTPPCADLILKYAIPQVVIGITDPNPKVAGNGITRLRAAGCKVKTGVLEETCREHHKRFLSSFEKKRPYIILKWAQTKDGYIAPLPKWRKKNPQPYWITNSQSRQLVHKWRSEEAAILVGKNTVIADNPKLDTRSWQGKNPVRLVIDKDLSIKKNANVLDGSIPTFIFYSKGTVPQQKQDKVGYMALDFDKNLPQQLCDFLYREQLNSIIVEGGKFTLQQFIDHGLWDEARIFEGNTSFGEGLQAPSISGKEKIWQQLLSDTLSVIYND